jgi:hypothetical protein
MIGLILEIIICGEILLILMLLENDHVKIDIIYHQEMNGYYYIVFDYGELIEIK